MGDDNIEKQPANSGKMNGTSEKEAKRPFLIGVAGGTASGKVKLLILVYLQLIKITFNKITVNRM